MKKILLILLFIPAFVLSSCLKDQEDIFDKNANERINERLAEFKSILTSAPNGWVFEYYPHENRNYGGYTYLVSFGEDGYTDVAFELYRNDGAKRSMYDVIYDFGPMLTFNTYNSYIHYFSEGTSRRYQGYKGDYEFMLVSYENGVITLKGKRSDNFMTLTMLEEGYDWDQYLADMYQLRLNAFFGAFYLDVNGQEQDPDVPNTVIRNNRIMTFKWVTGYTYDEETEDVIPEIKSEKRALVFLPDGIKLYEPIEIDGVYAETFEWDNVNQEFRSVDGNGEIVLKGYIPEGYFSYEDLLGSWYWDGNTSYPGTMEEQVYLESFMFNHRNADLEDYPFEFLYNSSFGGLELWMQELGTWGQYSLRLCALGEGYVIFQPLENYGSYFKATDSTGTRFKGEDGEGEGQYKVDTGWTIFMFTESGDPADYYKRLQFRNYVMTR